MIKCDNYYGHTKSFEIEFNFHLVNDSYYQFEPRQACYVT